jgi:hypothetical protein
LPTTCVHMCTVSQVSRHSSNGSGGQDSSIGDLSGKVEFELIHEAPAPIFARLNGTHDGVLGIVEMFGGVFVLRGIAAAHVPARQAQSQVNPVIPHFQAFLAAFRVRLHIVDLVHMSTFVHSGIIALKLSKIY